MSFSKSLFIAISFSAIILCFNLSSYFLNPIYFGEYIVGWDELQWQESSVHFYENGIGFESINYSLGLDGGFNNLGWPLLLGLVHNVFGLNYFNVILLKSFLYFLSVKYLFDILRRISFVDNEILLVIFFITIYHPMFVIRLTYLRDDVIVYFIIILLGLSSNLKYNFRSFINFLFIVLLSCILFFTRPFAYLVFLTLSIFYFKFFKIKYIYIYSLPVLLLTTFFFDFYSYIINFMAQFNFDFSKLVFDTLKFYIGPLPWKMLGIDSGYSPLWYIFSLFWILFFSFFIHFYKVLLRNWRVMFSVYLVSFIPYFISSFSHDSIGPRQFGMIAPFMFIIIYLPLFSRLFNLKRPFKF